MFTTVTEALESDTLALIPTHLVLCSTDDTVVPLTEGPYGRCTCCEVLTRWIDSVECAHICEDCQGDLDWTPAWTVAQVPLTV